MANLPPWMLTDGFIFGAFALIITAIMMPVMYLIGYRDGKKMNIDKWVLLGYKDALLELTGGIDKATFVNWMRYRSDPNVKAGLRERTA